MQSCHIYPTDIIGGDTHSACTLPVCDDGHWTSTRV